MLLVSFLLLCVGWSLGWPILPMFVAAALLQCAAAYAVTRNPRVNRIALATAMPALALFVLSSVGERFVAPLPAWVSDTATVAAYLAASIGLFASTMIGLFDPGTDKAIDSGKPRWLDKLLPPKL